MLASFAKIAEDKVTQPDVAAMTLNDGGRGDKQMRAQAQEFPSNGRAAREVCPRTRTWDNVPHMGD